MQISFGWASDIGKKKPANQDKILVKIGDISGCGDFGLFAVADGMGGMAAGEKASAIAMELLKKWWEELTPEKPAGLNVDYLSNELQKQFLLINEQIIKYGAVKGITLGTTLSVLFIFDSKYALCHIGDSRIYKVNEANLTQLTPDHSYVAEQVRLGRLSVEEAQTHPKQNVLTRCLGIKQEIKTFSLCGTVKNNDIMLLCSDGLYKNLNPATIPGIVKNNIKQDTNMQVIAAQLLKKANDNGGTDNISLILTCLKQESSFWQRLVRGKCKVVSKFRPQK
ncbi:MAG: protein phosphatase 2C domain-containing protein [Desulfotomaculum sp.]|nr:protein phosphatase 2C domain-containing protein [Desulfotomaculum sp.]